MNQSLPPYVVTWQAAGKPEPDRGAAYASTYPVTLRDGSRLTLPIRPLPGGAQAIALLMSNQTAFAVEQALASRMIELVRPLRPEMIVAVPTMGLDYARLVASGLGLPHYVALGLSRKFWYDDALSEATVSATSPEQQKRLYLDPALLDRLAGKRVVLIDDVMHTGVTTAAAVRLLTRLGTRIEAVAVVLTESNTWRGTMAGIDPQWPQKVLALGHIPLFRRTAGGWEAEPGTGAVS
jgi:adenine/guanine phosphoribosyltransferase-like PRPP-binding protein